MKTLTQTSFSPAHNASIKFSLLAKFFRWCGNQESNRFGWLALSLAAHGCIITPLAVALVVFTGNNFALWMAAMAAMGITLIVNLAAMPTKITIPTFVFSLIIDVVIVIAAITQLAG
jgi:hypothetical protein